MKRPFRKIGPVTVPKKGIFIAGAAALALVASSAISLSFASQSKTDQAQALVAEEIASSLGDGDLCFGASAMHNLIACPEAFTIRNNFGPDFAADDWGTLPGTTQDRYLLDPHKCENVSINSEPVWECPMGVRGSSKVLAVVGDSHGLALLEPLVLLATENGYEVRAFLHDSCSPQLPSQIAQESSTCDLWRESVASRVTSEGIISKVIVTGFSRTGSWVEFDGNKNEEINKYKALYEKWRLSGKSVFVIEDVPLTSGENVPECISKSSTKVDACALDRNFALGWDPTVEAVMKVNQESVQLVDLTDNFCDQEKCHSIIGGLIAYRDSHHLSGRFAQTLLPQLRDKITLK